MFFDAHVNDYRRARETAYDWHVMEWRHCREAKRIGTCECCPRHYSCEHLAAMAEKIIDEILKEGL